MGYCITQTESDFSIPNELKGGALAAIKNLRGRETIKDSSGYHFRWVDTDRFMAATTLVGAMAEWRYDITTDIATGDIFGIEFRGEKSGDEEYLFGAIAPFVVPDSYIQFRGEDGAIWRWIFDGQNAHEVNAVVTFPLPP